jgi:hypothetical protein
MREPRYQFRPQPTDRVTFMILLVAACLAAAELVWVSVLIWSRVNV